MKKTKIPRKFLLAGAVTLGVAGAATTAQALHPFSIDVELKDAAGQVICDNDTGTTTIPDCSSAGLPPYSPKQTCGGCHDYESAWSIAAKTQYNRSGDKVGYAVPFPDHGVSAGYHFQQGRNIDWDDTQRAAYGLPEFTSSPGMYGKY